ncbi:hypothetical protein L596_027131 [Steinernema carpocapsae]|uniref:Uncharacterized protein n=1 Tax=Steinernema carpocapsae TaxID=34508 RepID=A0A4U5M4B7_STECR|nr:hypothetical protein L596_027131 [Steinernema carpocapsae]
MAPHLSHKSKPVSMFSPFFKLFQTDLGIGATADKYLWFPRQRCSGMAEATISLLTQKAPGSDLLFRMSGRRLREPHSTRKPQTSYLGLFLSLIFPLSFSDLFVKPKQMSFCLNSVFCVFLVPDSTSLICDLFDKHVLLSFLQVHFLDRASSLFCSH